MIAFNFFAEIHDTKTDGLAIRPQAKESENTYVFYYAQKGHDFLVVRW